MTNYDAMYLHHSSSDSIVLQSIPYNNHTYLHIIYILNCCFAATYYTVYDDDGRVVSTGVHKTFPFVVRSDYPAPVNRK